MAGSMAVKVNKNWMAWVFSSYDHWAQGGKAAFL